MGQEGTKSRCYAFFVPDVSPWYVKELKLWTINSRAIKPERFEILEERARSSSIQAKKAI